jgi:glycosyltransferase involved in cell wall biosynthesis
MSLPFISVLIPCHNEEFFIRKCLDSILANDYQSDRMEIFVIDGLSTDNTLSILTDYAAKHSHIRLLSNPDKVFPAAVNTGIRESSGDFIFIMGAHAEYPQNYFSDCVGCSIENSADNVGGILKTIPVNNDFIGSLVSMVLSNPFGVGNSTFRTGAAEITEVDTVFGGCYKKEVFEKYGLFSKQLISTSDYEYNNRIRKQGAKIILNPAIVVSYYTRSSLRAFIKNNVRNGYWAIFPMAFTNNIPVSIRHFVPLVFVSAILSLIALSFKWHQFLYVLAALMIVYFVTGYYFSLISAQKKYQLVPLLSILFLILHFFYGLGSLWGIVRVSLHRLNLFKA